MEKTGTVLAVGPQGTRTARRFDHALAPEDVPFTEVREGDLFFLTEADGSCDGLYLANGAATMREDGVHVVEVEQDHDVFLAAVALKIDSGTDPELRWAWRTVLGLEPLVAH